MATWGRHATARKFGYEKGKVMMRFGLGKAKLFDAAGFKRSLLANLTLQKKSDSALLQPACCGLARHTPHMTAGHGWCCLSVNTRSAANRPHNLQKSAMGSDMSWWAHV